MPKKSVTTLFKQIQEGDQMAFNELFLAYHDKLLAFAVQYVKQQECAEEITSELFVKLWLRRTTLLDILNPEVYLYICIKNAALNFLRGSKKRIHITEDSEMDSSGLKQGDDSRTELETKELSRKLDEAIAALPEQRRIIFRLIKEDELKCREVASILNISVRTVENQMYKAVKTLADAISPYLGYHPQKRINRKQPLSELPLLFFL